MVKFPIRRKHWITIRRIGSHYYNLDSKLDSPERIGGADEVVRYLRQQVRSAEKELLLVVSTEVAQDGTWYQSEASTPPGKGDAGREENTQVDNKETRDSTPGGPTIGVSDVESDTAKLNLSEENSTATTQQDIHNTAHVQEHAQSETQTSAQATGIKINCKPAGTSGSTDWRTNSANGDIKRASSSADKYEVKWCDSRSSDLELTSHS